MTNKRYGAMSQTQKLRHVTKNRKWNLRKKLAEWHASGRDMKKVPTLRQYLHGADALYKSYGLTPKDVYIPPFVAGNLMGYKQTEEEKARDAQARRKFKHEKYGDYKTDIFANTIPTPRKLSEALASSLAEVLGKEVSQTREMERRLERAMHRSDMANRPVASRSDSDSYSAFMETISVLDSGGR